MKKTAARLLSPPPTPEPLAVSIVASAQLPTTHGHFRIFAFQNNRDQKDHVAVVHGQVDGLASVPVRLHSECLTGDVFSSLRCDCRQQLDAALDLLETLPNGIILYMRQEGRGIGLANKIRAYALQESGLDTVDANRHLGFDDDLRDYEVASEMLKLLGPTSINLMTNNPKKIDALKRCGVIIDQRTPLLIEPNPHNFSYLQTKKRRSGHLL
jgi:GTP cyclohydrolase II